VGRENLFHRSLIGLHGHFRSDSQRVNEAIEAVQEPGMPLDTLSRWSRQARLQALVVGFLAGVFVARRR
jgi:hypothetical protein